MQGWCLLFSFRGDYGYQNDKKAYVEPTEEELEQVLLYIPFKQSLGSVCLFIHLSTVFVRLMDFDEILYYG